MEPDEKVIKILVDEGKVDKKALIPIYKIHTTNKEPLEKLVIRFNLVGKKDMLEAKSRVFGGDPIILDPENIDIEVAKTIPQAMAKKYCLVCPRKTEDGKMLIAMHNPGDTFALEYVQMRTGIDVQPYIALLTDLEDAWTAVYAEDKKRRHPFFKDAPKNRKIRKIPSKLSLPGFKRTLLITEDVGKTQKAIKEATDIIREKTVEDDRFQETIDTIQKELEVFAILSHSGTILNSVMNEQEVIRKILETGAKICRAQGASILITQDQTLYFKEAIGPKSSELKKVRIPLSESSIAGWVAINKKPVSINNVESDERHFKGIDEMLHMKTQSVACVPLMWGDEVLGVMEAVNKQEGSFDQKDLDYLNILASQASVALHNAVLIEKFQNFYMEVVEILIECLESLDPVGRDHALQVARISAAIARELEVDEDEYESICYAAFLHDIGKIKCDENDIACHCVKGAQILSHIDFFQTFVPYVKYHHENFDGTGLPEGLSGQDIPLGARILAIADGFSMGRIKSPDMPPNEFLDQFLENFGSKYDPDLKEIFLKAHESGM